jgi:hypothetical protein
MCRPVTLVIVAFLTTIVAGCRTPPRKDLVEAELRVKDQDLRELRTALERTEAYTQSLQRELHAFQQMAPSQGVADVSTPAGVRSIVLARQTGGIDDDGVPGDEALQVVVEPRDADNHTVKAPGIVHVYALEVTPEGLKKPLSTWHVDAETLRKAWRTGLLSTGYYLTLPWRTWPANTKVRVIAQFVGQDERLFEADKDVTIRLTPDSQRKAPAPAEESPPIEGPPLPVLPREGDILPPPRKIEPEKKEEKSEKPFTPAASLDPDRPLKGAVELLRPVVAHDE